jgi:hypothetical protein
MDPVRFGRTILDCEHHYKGLYGVALKGLSREEGIAAAIEEYYIAPGKRGEILTVNCKTWCKEETEKLFQDFFRGEFTSTTFGRTEMECTIHFFVVLGMNFSNWGSSLQEGIVAVSEKYHQKQARKQMDT